MEGKTARVGSILIFALMLFCFYPKSESSSQTQFFTQPFVRILNLNIFAPLIFSETTNEDGLQKKLQDGVVHLPNSAKPGEVGNVYIVGHSSDYLEAHGGYKEVFRRLPEIRVGDLIEVFNGDRLFWYQVEKMMVVEPNELWVLSQETSGKHKLSLQTSYPVGTAKQRFIVVAEEVEK